MNKARGFSAIAIGQDGHVFLTGTLDSPNTEWPKDATSPAPQAPDDGSSVEWFVSTLSGFVVRLDPALNVSP
jgi:hypothetical protein